MVALRSGSRGGDARSLESYPNLLAGVGLALVGSHEEVAARIAEYHAPGIEEFVFSGYPHLEETYWFARVSVRHSPASDS